MFPHVALGAGTITGVTTFADGESVTITGTGFEADASPSPIKFDRFDGGTNGATLSGWDYISSSNGNTDPHYDGSVNRTNSTNSIHCEFMDVPEADYNSTFGMEDDAVLSVYLSAWQYVTTPQGVSRSIKPIRFAYDLTGGIYQDPVMGHTYQPVGPNSFIWFYPFSSSNQVEYVSGVGGPTTGQWVKVEYWFNLGTLATSDAEMYFWEDHALQKSLTGFQANDDGKTINIIHLGHYFARDEPGTGDPQGNYWWDDVYISDTLSRVELCDNATWASRTQCEIQPVSARSTTSITISAANQGAFSASGTAYLYVVDSDNTVSAGYEITIGSVSNGVLMQGITSTHGVTME